MTLTEHPSIPPNPHPAVVTLHTKRNTFEVAAKDGMLVSISGPTPLNVPLDRLHKSWTVTVNGVVRRAKSYFAAAMEEHRRLLIHHEEETRRRSLHQLEEYRRLVVERLARRTPDEVAADEKAEVARQKYWADQAIERQVQAELARRQREPITDKSLYYTSDQLSTRNPFWTRHFVGKLLGAPDKIEEYTSKSYYHSRRDVTAHYWLASRVKTVERRKSFRLLSQKRKLNRLAPASTITNAGAA